MEKLKRIQIGDKELPILCDLNVLEVAQEEFGSVNEFELALLGIKLIKDENGKQRFFENGNPMMLPGEPSIKAIRIALTEMVNEGLSYEAYHKGIAFEPVDERDILADCKIPFTDLSQILHDEYKKCFETKKAMPREPRQKKAQK